MVYHDNIKFLILCYHNKYIIKNQFWNSLTFFNILKTNDEKIK
jgi:hypothetical protein